MLLEPDFLADPIHGSIGCVVCHGGAPSSSEKALAHQGMVRDPSEDPVGSCGQCHQHRRTAEAFTGSIHFQLTGERTFLEDRMGDSMENHPEIMEGFEGECGKCHATCGQCHVSRPNAVGGGFVDGHVMVRTPDMLNQCTACHGSRVGDEFRGKHNDEIEDYKGDVHYLAGHRCEFCHGAAEMHRGQGAHRYEVDLMPRCEDCHEDAAEANGYHAVHWGELGCSVCHSQDYKSCERCHAPNGLDDESWLSFKIGRNPFPELREYEYVTLRHVPVTHDTYAGWGYEGDLPEFDAWPTWKYTVPHNIRRWTARTEHDVDEACGSACHGSPATLDGYFLRQVDLDEMPDVAEANAAVIVPDASPLDWEPLP